MMQCVKFNGSSCVKHTIYKNIFKEPQRFIVILQQKMLEQCLPFRSFQALKLAPPTARSDTFPAKTNSPGITSFNRRGVVDHFLCNSPLKQHRALEMVNCSFKFSTTGIKAANCQKKNPSTTQVCCWVLKCSRLAKACFVSSLGSLASCLQSAFLNDITHLKTVPIRSVSQSDLIATFQTPYDSVIYKYAQKDAVELAMQPS